MRCGSVRLGEVWSGEVRFGMVRYGLVWYGLQNGKRRIAMNLCRYHDRCEMSTALSLEEIDCCYHEQELCKAYQEYEMADRKVRNMLLECREMLEEFK